VLSLRKCANIIHQVPAIHFGDSFAVCGIGFLPVVIFQKRDPSGSVAGFDESFAENIEPDHGRAVRVSSFP
jgi:hypothetical protein